MNDICPLCNDEAGARPPCIGCGVRYHPPCIRRLGCSSAGCPMVGVRGRSILPQPGLLSIAARGAWMFVVACVIAFFVRDASSRFLSAQQFFVVTFFGAAAACVLTAAAYVRDLATPAGRALAREGRGRAAAFAVLAVWFVAIANQFLPVALFGWLGLIPALAYDQSRPDRLTHHPLRSPLSVRMFEGAIVVAIIGVLAAIAVPNFKSPRTHSPTRACYANQKTVAGAIEFYNLDKNTKRTVLDAAFFADLKSGGYLQSIPQDPWFGPGSSSHYHGVPDRTGVGITCEAHGSIR